MKPAWLAMGGLRRLGLILLMLCTAFPAAAMERRREQFPTEPSYLIVPFPYSLPGIGDGIVWTALGGNLLGTHTDVYVLGVTGDAGGNIIGLEDIHLLPETVILDLNIQNLNKAVVNNYESRGMESNQDDFSLIELNRVKSVSAQLRLTLLDRMFELGVGMERQDISVVRIRDSEGGIIADLADPFEQRTDKRFVSVLVDYTDDYNDPRRGVRLRTVVSHTPPNTDNDPDFYVWDYSLSGYIPVGSISTLLLYYFQSDADVRRKGNTNPADIQAELGLNCAPLDTQCLLVEQQLIQTFVNSRSNGTSTSLGGDERLRSYPGDRFQGAHTMFFAAEFRWNLTEESTPFNYFIWKDVRTNVQWAFFAETGSVGETRDEVGDTFRSSVGTGLRLISGSGYAYRADIATGSEGAEVTVIFNYPF